MKNINHPSETLPIDNHCQTGLPLFSGGVFIMVGIYKITNPKNKVYIGQSSNIERRFAQYRCYSCERQIRLLRSFKKYGVNSHKFEIITLCDKNQLNDLERFYQDIYCSTNENGLNCILTKTGERTGTHPMTGKKHSLETIRKMQSCKPSEETKNKMRHPHKPFSEETLKKIRESRKPISDITREKQRLIAFNRPKPSIETRIKMSISRKGRKHTEEAKHKMSLSSRAHNNINYGKIYTEQEKRAIRESTGRLILDAKTGIFFYGCREAAKAYNLNSKSLYEMLNNKYHNKTNLKYI